MADDHRHACIAAGVPVTAGREFVQESAWNFWFDGRGVDNADRRNGVSINGNGTYLSLGADRRLGNGVVFGGLLTYETSDSTGFDGSFTLDAEGFGAGLYLAQALSVHWALDASLTYGRTTNDTRIDVLAGSYVTQRGGLVINASAQYERGEYRFQPKFTLSYSHFDNEAYAMRGQILGIPITLPVARDSFDHGAVEASSEIHRAFPLGSHVIVPYAEAGIRYDLMRPGDGRVLTADLTLASTSPWVGFARMGARALLSRATFVEGAVGYLSLGQGDLDIWEIKLFVSHAY